MQYVALATCSRMPGCMICGISHPTTLLFAGVPVHVVAARLGHADPSVTLRVYAHVIREQVAEAADIFTRSVPAADSPAVSKSVSKKALLSRLMLYTPASLDA